MQTVTVDLGERSYDIVIGAGLLRSARVHLEPIVRGRRVALVSEAPLAERFLPQLEPSLGAVTNRWDTYLIEGGESAKSFAGVERLLDDLLADGIDRSCVLVAFGGGVVGDVAGFAAALLMRGIELIQVPTTLMSQVDSAVGGKNAINTRQGKNLVGSFLQPRIVLNDVSVLGSLPPAEMRAGYAEVIKYGLLRGEAQFSWLEANAHALLSHDEATLIEAVQMGCETKAAIVSEDELDKGKRALVNLGHTFAHAFEAQGGFGHVPHGAAVAVGLVAASDLSERVGVCGAGLADRIRAHVRSAGLPVDLTDLSGEVQWCASELREHMLHDKKTVGGRINFVLLRHLGDAFVTTDVPSEALDATLHSLGAT